MSHILLDENAIAPGTPAAAKSILYPKSDGLWYTKDDAGVETAFAVPLPVSVVNGGTSFAAYTTGDILYASGAAALAKLAAVAVGQIIISQGVGVAPIYSATLPTAVQDNITRLGTITSGVWNAGAVTSNALVTTGTAIDGTVGALFGSAASTFGAKIFRYSTDLLLIGVPGATASQSFAVVTNAGNAIARFKGDLATELSGTLAVTGTVTGGTYNGQTISSAASFTGSAKVATNLFVGGVTPSAWDVTIVGIEGLTSATRWSLKANGDLGVALNLSNNAYYSTGNWLYGETAAAANYYLSGGTHNWRVAASGTSGAAISWLTGMSLSEAGLLTVSGFGTHSFSAGGNGSQVIQIQNTTSGTAARAYLGITAGTTTALLLSYSQGYTTSGVAIAGATTLYALGSAGINIVADHATGLIDFYSGGVTRTARFHASRGVSIGDITDPGANNFRVAGTSALVGNVTVGNSLSFTGTSTYSPYAFIPSSVSLYIQAISGNIATINGSTGVYAAISDKRLKSDRGRATDLSALRALRVHDYIWKRDGAVDRNVFAQEAHKVSPRGVTVGTTKDDPWMFDRSTYVPDLIVGWQQHDARIAKLEARQH